MPDALFLHLLASDDKGADLAASLAAAREGLDDARVFQVDPEFFRQIPGAPFAYWVSERARRLFHELSPFEGEGRKVEHGLSTKDDFRFVRTWWEVAPERILDAQNGPEWREDLRVFQTWCRRRTHEGKCWVLFAKGGEYSPYYADVHLLVNWEHEGAAIESHVVERYPYLRGNAEWVLHRACDYFRPGLTWPRRTTSGMSVRGLSAGCIFADKAPTAFCPEPPSWLALMQSRWFSLLVKTQLGAADAAARSYEVGLIQRTPVPSGLAEFSLDLADQALRIAAERRALDTSEECSHIFVSPTLPERGTGTLSACLAERLSALADADAKYISHQSQIDQTVAALYGVSSADFGLHNAEPSSGVTEAGDLEEEVEEDEAPLVTSPSALASSLASYLLGCVFGRWDVRLATGERPVPELPDPFDPLPVGSLGMLQGEDGLPLHSTPEGYALPIDWDGILVDDPSHPDDLLARIRQVLEVVYQERAGVIEAELNELLGVKDLRDYFRRPTKGGFWIDHVARYSKSRRKAPIYWLLQSKKKNYALWLYYHRLDRDLLYKALVNYVEPRLRLEEARLKELEQNRLAAGPTGREAKQLAREAEAQEELIQELTEFAQALSRAAELQLRPDLDDGVLLNIAPLWELVPWKEAATAWQELLKGKYSWSSIGQQLKERGMVRG